MHPHQLSRDQLETQARAKVFWGETPESIVIFLISYGISNEEAWGIVQQMQAERAASIRAAGVKRMIIGGVLILVPFGTYVALSGAGMLSLKLFAIAIAIGVYGVWKLIEGSLNLIFPEAEKGDLADDSEA